MSIKRFFSATARDAMRQVRAELGDEAVILSNRAVEGGVEVIASGEDDVRSMIARTPSSRPEGNQAGAGTGAARATAATAAAAATASVPANHAAPAAHRAHAAATAPASLAGLARAAFAAAPRKAAGPSQLSMTQPSMAHPANGAAQSAVAEPFAQFVQRTGASKSRTAADLAEASAHPSAALAHGMASYPGEQTQMMAEIQQVKSILQEQMGALAWRETASRRPLQARLTAQMLAAGFSPLLARAFADRLPVDFDGSQANLWLHETLIRNIQTAEAGAHMVEKGGVYAFVGPTGVGKTTTAAKLAAACVLSHGAAGLGLITVDNYRIGAEDQLRAYGNILGVTVHTAHDQRTLADLVALMRDKHLVLIDTVGMGQRDPRLPAQLRMLDIPRVERVLFLNAGAQAENLEDVIGVYGGSTSAPATAGNSTGAQLLGQRPGRATKVIVSKIDEAVKYGAVLDCLIRHKLQMQYVTNGQRVPEDLHRANPQYLVHRAMKHRPEASFALEETDVPLMLFAGGGAGDAARNARTARHA